MKKPFQIFNENFNKKHLNSIFDQFLADGTAVGRDGIRVDKFAENIEDNIDIILRKVNAQNYDFTSYREKLISKGPDRPPRQISIPTIRDKLLLKFVSQFLVQVYPEHASHTPHSIIKRVHDIAAKSNLDDQFLRLDIKNYYPSINHGILIKILKKKIRKKQIISLLHDALSTPTGRKKVPENRNEKGVPQGLSISNILSAIYFSVVDKEIESFGGVEYFRYVDDILIVGAPDVISRLSEEVPTLLESRLKISCHPVGQGGKSTIVDIGQGIEYLGYKFCGREIEVRDASFKKMFMNIMKVITSMKYGKNNSKHLWRLNLRISGCRFKNRNIGWMFFFSQTKNMRQLMQLDEFVYAKARKYLNEDELKKLKRFIRSYHEIRFNSGETEYFPNFDDFDDEQKKKQIQILRPELKYEEIEGMNSSELHKLFVSIIRRETSDLEKDMMEAFS